MTEERIREDIMRHVIKSESYLRPANQALPYIVADWIIKKAHSPKATVVPSVQARRLFEDVQGWALGYCVKKVKEDGLQEKEAADFMITVAGFLSRFVKNEKETRLQKAAAPP